MDGNSLSPNPPSSTNTAGPNFRSFPPTTTGNIRTFPRIYDLVAGISPAYEVLSSVTRAMNFRVTARDQAVSGGCVAEADVTVNVSSLGGPFTITSQASPVTWIANGTNTQTITWNVANTNNPPVNCTAVDISFSIDGGITFPYILAGNTNNDGTEIITVPNIPTSAGRIKVQAVNNIFFNINQSNITITSTCAAEGSTFAPSDSLAAAAGSSLLNLPLSPQYGVAFTPAGTITVSNPSTTLPIYNTSVPSCAVYGFNSSYKYDTYSFVVTTPNTYTFTPSNYGLVYNLYYEAFNPTFPCNNFIASNTVTGGVPTTINPTVSAYLTPGHRYILTAGSYSSTYPVLPFSYTVPVSGGSIYTNPPNPGAAFTYLYVVVENTTNLIKSIASSANLSNSTTYPGSTNYTVYGLSYSNTSPSLNSFVGTNFITLTNALLYNALYCGNLSKNTAKVTVLTIYTFTGNGNWDVPANWSNNTIPPSPLPPYSEISIDPIISGECILNVPAIVPQGDKITVQPGKKFKILGNLIQN